MNRALQALGRVGASAAIALAATALQSVRLPAVLDGPTLRVALGEARNPHLLTSGVTSIIASHCDLSAPCFQHWNLAVFGLAVFFIAILAGRRMLGLWAVTIAAISPLAVAVVVDPIGAGLSIAILLVVVAAIDVGGLRTYPTIARCIVGAALAFADPALVPLAVVYGAFGGVVPLIVAVGAAAARFFLVAPTIDQLAGPATMVAFGACLFIGGPLLMLARRYRAFRMLDDNGTALVRAGVLALACIAGALFSASGDVAPYWLAGEAALLVGLVASLQRAVETQGSDRAALALVALFLLQVGLFSQYHNGVTTAAIAFRGDDLRGMLASSSKRACVAIDPIASHYVLADGAFLRVYPPAFEPRLTKSVSDCTAMPPPTLVVTMVDLAVNDWGTAIPLMEAYRDAENPASVLQIEGGDVSPPTKIPTPTGRGSFGNQFDSPLGRVGDFTVVSGFTYTPRCVAVATGKHLDFSAASIPGTPELHLRVTTSTPNGVGTLLDQTFPASRAGEPYRWWRFSVPVPPTDCAALSFAVTAGADARYWLIFAGASIR